MSHVDLDIPTASRLARVIVMLLRESTTTEGLRITISRRGTYITVSDRHGTQIRMPATVDADESPGRPH